MFAMRLAYLALLMLVVFCMWAGLTGYSIVTGDYGWLDQPDPLLWLIGQAAFYVPVTLIGGGLLYLVVVYTIAAVFWLREQWERRRRGW